MSFLTNNQKFNYHNSSSTIIQWAKVHQISINEMGPPIKAMRNCDSQGLAWAVCNTVWKIGIQLWIACRFREHECMYMQEALSLHEGMNLGWRVTETQTKPKMGKGLMGTPSHTMTPMEQDYLPSIELFSKHLIIVLFLKFDLSWCAKSVIYYEWRSLTGGVCSKWWNLWHRVVSIFTTDESKM